MQSLPPSTPALPTCPQLRRLPYFSPQNHELVAAYLAHLRARHYAASTLEGALCALTCFAALLPKARQALLYQELTQTTPADIDAWIAAAFQQGLAPGTLVTCRRALHRFFVFLCDHGVLAQSPIQLPRHQILVPTRLPRPMAEAEVVAFFRVIDALEDRTIFLLMLRCGLRVSEVSSLRWTAIDMAQGTLRINNSKGQVDRVVYQSPDVATALRQWHGLHSATTGAVFPSRMTRQRGLPLGARQIRNRMTRYLQLAGITKRYSPHSLRHTFATQLLNAGASLEVVKELMGHRSLQMTLRYTQLYDRTKRTQYDRVMAQVEQQQGLQRR
jgi:site-specific recombinase XerD